MNPIKRALIKWLLKYVPPCETVTHQLSEAMDHRLSWRDRFFLRLHLFTCDWCTRYGQQIELVDKVVRGKGSDSAAGDHPQHPLPVDVRDRLKRRLSDSRD